MNSFILKDFQNQLEEIVDHGKTLKHLKSALKTSKLDMSVTERDVQRLETLWQKVWLHNLEWECLLENCLSKQSQEDSSDDQDSDEEFLKVSQNCEDRRVADKAIKSYPKSHGFDSPRDCDSSELSSDSGFSDLSLDFADKSARNFRPPTDSTLRKPGNIEHFSGMKLSDPYCYQEHDQKVNRFYKKKSHKFRLIIWGILLLMIVMLTLSLFMSLVHCHNNTCAINIMSHIRYHNTRNLVF